MIIQGYTHRQVMVCESLSKPLPVKELHLDLHCWMAYAARVMEAYASFTNDRTRSQEYGKLYDDLLTSLNGTMILWKEIYRSYAEYHWNDEQQIYLDVAGWTEGKIQHVNHMGMLKLESVADC